MVTVGRFHSVPIPPQETVIGFGRSTPPTKMAHFLSSRVKGGMLSSDTGISRIAGAIYHRIEASVRQASAQQGWWNATTGPASPRDAVAREWGRPKRVTSSQAAEVRQRVEPGDPQSGARHLDRLDHRTTYR